MRLRLRPAPCALRTIRRLLPLALVILATHASGAAQSPDDPAATGPTGPTGPSASAALPPVRVRLLSLGSPRHLSVSADGPIRALDLATGDALEVPSGAVVIGLAEGQLTVGAQHAAALRLEASVLHLEIGRARHAYPGALILSPNGHGIGVTNECSLEEYTAGVLAGECPALFHPEAIKAMAVAVRSYCYRKAFLNQGELCDGVHCQVYRGAKGVRPSIRQAVQATEGLCATFDGEVIDAVYCSDCGGCTEANDAAWRGTKPAPYLRPVEDAPEPQGEPYCAVDRRHAWSLTLSQARLRSLLGKPEPDLTVEILDVSESGRVRRLQVVPSPAEVDPLDECAPPKSGRVFTGEEWRRVLGASVLKSLLFRVTKTATGVELTGEGYGHGVGLCQFGANGMAHQGVLFEDILKHYYTGVEIVPAPVIPAVLHTIAKPRDLASRHLLGRARRTRARARRRPSVAG